MAVASMRMIRRRLTLAWPALVVAAALVLLSVLGTAAAAARPLEGEVDGWVVASGGAGPSSIVETLRRLYLQQLGGPGASCGTNSPNNGCPP
ncbi:hypothetical protein E2562_037139 [Oryza meyeriana var. granulata]|uniref:Uncharacterized protein n=1 Tax=Oryza meyeriana var. granulata TaxID=110450 RepID=A0A6G1CXI2_9ORYZ|nr:hypothetical protein E2562_037139 [Oryza meyeriana var. granulata]